MARYRHGMYVSTTIAYILLAIVLLIYVGCSSTQTTDTAPNKPDETRQRAGERMLPPASTLLIRDLPVPAGFQLVEPRSRQYQAANSRVVDHTYRGLATRSQIERFYRHQMPLRDWTYRGSQMIRGDLLIRYEKGHDLAEIRVLANAFPFHSDVATILVNVQTVGPR